MITYPHFAIPFSIPIEARAKYYKQYQKITLLFVEEGGKNQP
jgi:hypothetical protein